MRPPAGEGAPGRPGPAGGYGSSVATRPSTPSARRERLAALGLSACVFASGAAIIGLEFVGQRMLAVVWGDSLAVWGATIGVVLGGLAIGYGAGGRLADRRPVPGTLLVTLVAGGVLLEVEALLGGTIVDALGEAFPGVRSGSLLGSMAVLFPPTVVLAMTSPVAVRLSVESLGRAGRSAGDVYAIGTLGSIAGALLTTFFMIDVLELKGIVGVYALALFAAAALWTVGLVLTGRLGTPSLALAGSLGLLPLAVLTAVALNVPSVAVGSRDRFGDVVRVADESRYHRIVVTDSDQGSRRLYFGNRLQSEQDRQDGERLVLPYAVSMQRGACYAPRARRVALIGVGAGTLIRSARRLHPGVRVDAVDIDPAVIDVAHRWFRPPRDARVRYVAEDGRRFLDRTRERYDAVLIDAFTAERLPPHLLTAEFFQLVRSRLAPGGVVVMNTIENHGAPTDSPYLASIARTLGAVWPSVEAVPGRPGNGGSSTDNVLFAAGPSQLGDARACWARAERAFGLRRGRIAGLRPLALRGEGRVFTDGRPPLDSSY